MTPAASANCDEHLEHGERRPGRAAERGGAHGAAGLEAFARRRASHSGVDAHEQSGEPELGDEQRAAFERRPGSWEFLQAQAPSYRKAVLWWVVNAKRAETRATRLATVVDECAAGRQVRHLRRGGSGG